MAFKVSLGPLVVPVHLVVVPRVSAPDAILLVHAPEPGALLVVVRSDPGRKGARKAIGSDAIS